MKTIKFNVPIYTFKGEQIKEEGKILMLSEVFSNLLANAQSDNSRKMANWSRLSYNKGEIIIDKVDESFLKTFIEDSKISNLLKDQLLQCFDEARDVE